MDWETHKKHLLKDPGFRKALEETRPEYEIARAMILARVKHKLTQKQLAQRLNTRQSVISRVENARTTPSVSFLKRFASTFGGKLKISFEGI
ncbi:helix-turn-helix transcriptional regulator [Candidatus Parcubacteria bacterium]|nr:helix-turn-helix transcriptional regulator [Nanoarchaeota archaeon]MCG2685964.1 helix-turn-helix transcriptional regulator [Candidatus Parcubacteria bacterium]